MKSIEEIAREWAHKIEDYILGRNIPAGEGGGHWSVEGIRPRVKSAIHEALEEHGPKLFEAGFHARPTPMQTGWQFDPHNGNMMGRAAEAYTAYKALSAQKGAEE